MKTDARIWLLFAGLALMHLLLHVGFGIGRAAPDLLTVALLLGAREVGMGRAAGMGLLFGLLEDALSVLSFGANSVAMTIVAALMLGLRPRAAAEFSFLLGLVTLGGATALYGSLLESGLISAEEFVALVRSIPRWVAGA